MMGQKSVTHNFQTNSLRDRKVAFDRYVKKLDTAMLLLLCKDYVNSLCLTWTMSNSSRHALVATMMRDSK
jgi:hypothetical protein